jgi:formylmethanofuran dehydrogenase subunit E
MLNRLFKAMAMIQEGISCRRCGEGISRHDHFGLSESTCRSCRG